MSNNHMKIPPVSPVFPTKTDKGPFIPNHSNCSDEKKNIKQNETKKEKNKIKEECNSCNHFKSVKSPLKKSEDGYFGMCNCEEFKSKVKLGEVHSTQVQWYSQYDFLKVDESFCCEYYEPRTINDLRV